MDYKSLHLAWIKKTPSFSPKFAQDYTESYYDIIVQLYKQRFVTNEVAQQFFAADMQWFNTCNQQLNSLSKQVTKSNPMSPIFVTIGFNHQTWNVSSCVKVIETIVKFDWINTIHAVFEYHRANGLHPHVHMLITLNQPLAKSKVLEKIWATAGIKKIVLSKSFIDYKVAEEYHKKYIMGEKQESKMSFVEKDKEWRKKNNIKEYYSKN